MPSSSGSRRAARLDRRLPEARVAEDLLGQHRAAEQLAQRGELQHERGHRRVAQHPVAKQPHPRSPWARAKVTCSLASTSMACSRVCSAIGAIADEAQGEGRQREVVQPLAEVAAAGSVPIGVAQHTGAQPSCTAKTVSSSRPTQNVGAEARV
jgi:hypothetical protein